ncbi:MAG TPA: transcriptional repressor [Alphaproteobacteria bacterium]|nr:transcriptional repressor [Alphaproteobacteria bacterium]
MTAAAKKLSPHNQKVLDLLKQSARPLSAYAILDKLHRYGFRSPPTVYRALDYLVKHGLAHKLESLGSFVACQQHEDHDHLSQFLLCTECGGVEEMEDKSLLKLAKKLGGKFLARINKEVFELSGICHACSRKG